MKNLRDTKRLNMIEQQIRTWDVLDERILDLYHQVEREDFVVDTAHRNLAYGDLSLPIGEGEVMLEPKLEARMLQILAPVAGKKSFMSAPVAVFLPLCWDVWRVLY